MNDKIHNDFKGIFDQSVSNKPGSIDYNLP
jgi:hypothetical protein